METKACWARRVLSVWTFAVLLLLQTLLAVAESGRVDVTQLSRWSAHLMDNVTGVAIQSNLVYTVGNGAMLEVADIGNPSNPHVLGRWIADGSGYNFYSIAVNGDYAYVLDPENLLVLSITNALHPSLLASYATAGDARDLVATTNHVYLAAGTNGLEVVEVVDASQPKLAGLFKTGGQAMGVKLLGSLAYIADGTNGLQILDIADPAAPISLGGCDTAGTAADLAVQGNIVYVADGTNGLQIVDATDPSHPTPIGRQSVAGYAGTIAVSGQLAYLGDQDVWAGPTGGGLLAINVSNPTQPMLRGTYRTVENAILDLVIDAGMLLVADFRDGLHVLNAERPNLYGWQADGDFPLSPAFDTDSIVCNGHYAYVATMSDGLLIYDLADPLSPTNLATYKPANANYGHITVNGNYAYIESMFKGLAVVDIANPSAPQALTNYPSLQTRILAMSGQYAYGGDILSELSTFQILDLNDPVTVRLLGSLSVTGSIHGIAVSGNKACVAVGDDSWGSDGEGLVVIDVSDPTQPKRLSSLPLSGSPTGIAASGEFAYVSVKGWQPGLDVIDIGDPNNPRFLRRSATVLDPANLLSEKGRAIVVSEQGTEIELFDLSGAEAPVSRGAYSLFGEITSAAIAGTHVYAVVADPATSKRRLQALDGFGTRHVSRTGATRHVAVAGDIALLADGYSGAHLLDIRNATEPVRLASVGTVDECRSTCIAGSTAFLACDSAGLQVLDISDIASPQRIAVYTVTNDSGIVQAIWGCAVAGTNAYVTDDTGLSILDVSDPSVPRRLSRFAPVSANPESVTVTNGLAYVADRSLGLLIVDVTDPRAPVLRGSLSLDYANEVVVSGTYAYVADGGAGLSIVDVSDPAVPRLIKRWPTSSYNCWAVAVEGSRVYMADDGNGVVVLDVSDPANPYECGKFSAYRNDGSDGWVYGIAVAGGRLFTADLEAGLAICGIEDTGLPIIQMQPANLTVKEGETATFSVTAKGSEPLSYQWRKDGINIPGSTNASLSLTAVSTNQAGGYDVVVGSERGSVLSSAATLTVSIVPHFITKQPTSIMIPVWGTAQFSVETGPGTYGYQWKAIVNGNQWFFPTGTNAVFKLEIVDQSYAGSYFCEVTDLALGQGTEVSAQALLTVMVPPGIAVQPVAQTVVEGSDVSFSVTTTGDSPLWYQWRRNGVSIDGATSDTLVLTNVTSAQTASYSVKVSNPVGSVVSQGAKLTVLVRPSIVVPPASSPVT